MPDTGVAVSRPPASSGQPLVRLSALTRHFDVSPPWLARVLEGKPRAIVQAVAGIDIEIRKGETFSLVGESGCGKSTVARLVVGLYPPTAGSIEFDGNDMTTPRGRTEMSAIRRRMQMIFQDPFASLNPRWRVFDIIAEPIRAFKMASSPQEVRQRVDDLQQGPMCVVSQPSKQFFRRRAQVDRSGVPVQ